MLNELNELKKTPILTRMTLAERVQMAQPAELPEAISSAMLARYQEAFSDVTVALQGIAGEYIQAILPYGSAGQGLACANDYDFIIVLRDYDNDEYRQAFLRIVQRHDWVRCDPEEYEGCDGEFVALRSGDYNIIVMGFQEAACALAGFMLTVTLGGLGIIYGKQGRGLLHEAVRQMLLNNKYVPEAFDFGNPPRVD